MDLEPNFHLLAEKVSLAAGQRERVERQLKRLKEFVEEDSILADYSLDKPRTQGSYAHDTIVRPLASDAVFDVDVLLPIDLQSLAADRWGGELWDTWDDIHGRLKVRYQASVRKRARCLRISYADGFRVDLVPGQPTTTNLRGEYAIIDREQGELITTNPLAYNAWVKGVNKELGGFFVPAVRILKRWRDLNLRGAHAPKSIFLTTLAGTAFASYHEKASLQIVSREEMSLQNLVVDLATCMNHYLRFSGPSDLPIPGSPDEDLMERQSSQTIAKLRTGLDRFAARAAKALTQRNEGYAIGHWQHSLGTEFPVHA